MVTSATSLNDLLTALDDCEQSQHKIYDTYRRAAEKDLEFKDLRIEEQKIRRYIYFKVNSGNPNG